MHQEDNQNKVANVRETNHELIEARRDYEANTLRRDDLIDNPLEQFTQWLGDARAKKVIDATAMALSTVDQSGQPHSRIVLLKQFDDAGFVFYTNYRSDKGCQLQDSNKACLLFYWRELERQVRIEGTVSFVEPALADSYFDSRPAGSRFSAAASEQSTPVENRSVLEKAVEKLEREYPNGDIPRPAHWGGYRLTPTLFEFWQGRADRLHDRFQYTSTTGSAEKNKPWTVNRLAP